MNLDYLAGFTDADGNFGFTISFRKTKYQAKSGEKKTYNYITHYETFRIGQGHIPEKLRFLKEVQQFLNERGIYSFITHHKKISYSLVISGMKQVGKLVKLLKGMLILKESEREAMEKIIAICQQTKRGEYTADLYLKLARIWDNSTKFRKRHGRFRTLEAKVCDIYGIN